MSGDVTREPSLDVAESQTPCMRGNFIRENRETRTTPSPDGVGGRSGKAKRRTPDTDGAEWTAAPGNATDVDDPTLYTGRWQDFRTSLYDSRNRYDYPEPGRSIDRGPIGYAGGTRSLCEYVEDIPANLLDSTGKAIQ